MHFGFYLLSTVGATVHLVPPTQNAPHVEAMPAFGDNIALIA